MSSNTAPNSVPGVPFVKGDPRINRKGRPKTFDAFRKLAQALANEPAKDANGRPIIIDGHVATQAEMIARAMMKENPERFVEIAYGRVPQPIELSGAANKPIEIKAVNPIHDYRAILTPLAPATGSMADSTASGQDEGDLCRPPLGEIDAGDGD